MNRPLRIVFAIAYVAVTALLLGGVVKHSAWFLAGLEPVADDWFGWWLAAALDGALIVSTCTLVVYQLQSVTPPAIVRRAFWLFLLYSTVANLSHALAHNHLQDWSSGQTWWYWMSSIVGAALLPTALAIMPHAAEAVLAQTSSQPSTQPSAKPPTDILQSANDILQNPPLHPSPTAALAAKEQTPRRKVAKPEPPMVTAKVAAKPAKVTKPAKRGGGRADGNPHPANSAKYHEWRRAWLAKGVRLWVNCCVGGGYAKSAKPGDLATAS